MTIPVTQLHILRVLLQVEQNLSGLQRDMRANALAWNAVASAQSQPVATLAQWMNDAATAYQSRIAWLSTFQTDTANYTKMGAMWALLGGTSQDFNNVITPITAVANQLGPASKTTYAEIIGVCGQITTAINMPLSIWPE